MIPNRRAKSMVESPERRQEVMTPQEGSRCMLSILEQKMWTANIRLIRTQSSIHPISLLERAGSELQG